MKRLFLSECKNRLDVEKRKMDCYKCDEKYRKQHRAGLER